MTTTGAGAGAGAGAGTASPVGAGAGGRTPPVLRLYHELLADRERLIEAHHRLLAEQNALLEQIDLLCARSTAAGSDTPCGSPPPLSPVQRQVLVLMAGGAKDGAIARRLNLSERSVRRQVESLTRRTGASNRFTLALAAIRIGWLPAGR
ncbi:helix-turn-helix transcriptional regulator [Streptomyces avidinii]|uniref:DNA-binding NarL/FixJ family response regulator n=2 Tax=Streptomyces avidinii TaxID=1895 RepID=A0ABS4KWY7_STRAV|nr:LuxR C-terminal-related transcriptional regulator [Streptomyces avidinii]MBP2034540.1 DNA-binding NarL/FixJ family response regulator [Streptomyces avidinii]